MIDTKYRIKSLDGIRGIACCVIAFLWHYLNMQSRKNGMPYERIFNYFYSYGLYAVELFFMLSGFVMAYAYKSRIENGLGFKEYMIKRYKHIYPLMILTLISVSLLQFTYKLLVGNYYIYKCDLFHFILNIFVIQNGWISTEQSFNGPAWCISVEIFCYILFYIIAYYSKKSKYLYCILSGIIIFISVVIINSGLNYPILNWFMARGVGSFFLGVLINKANFNTNEVLKRRGTFYLLSLVICYYIIAKFNNINIINEEISMQNLSMFVISPMVIWYTINLKVINRFFSLKIFQYLGSISLDIYMWHISIQLLIKIVDELFNLDLNYKSTTVFIIYIVLVLIISSLSHKILKSNKGIRYFGSILVITLLCANIIINIYGPKIITIENDNFVHNNKSEFKTINNKTSLSKGFYCKDSITDIIVAFYTITWQASYNNNKSINIQIVNRNNQEVVYETTIKCNEFSDSKEYKLNLEDLYLKANTEYSLNFSTNLNSSDPLFALLLLEEENPQNVEIFSSKDQNTLALKLIGKRSKQL